MDRKNSCWSYRTPLETGLILILIVAVPFLIGMTTVYTILLLRNCPNCSITCLEFCNNDCFRSSVLPMVLKLNPSVSVPKLTEKYEICPESMLNNFDVKVDHAFVASIFEDVYVDELTDQRYVCAAAIITFSWVVTSSRCIQADNRSYTDIYGVFVRAGSNYWMKQGSVHEIKRVVFADQTISSRVAAIELKTEFPRLPSIRPIMLSRTSLYKNLGVAEMYSWKSNDSIPLKLRKKYVEMSSEPMIIFKDAQCEDEAKYHPHVFCATAVKRIKEGCIYYNGFPIIRSKILMGVEIGEFCDEKQNVTVHLIYDIANALSWLEKTTGVHVKHLEIN